MEPLLGTALTPDGPKYRLLQCWPGEDRPLAVHLFSHISVTSLSGILECLQARYLLFLREKSELCYLEPLTSRQRGDRIDRLQPFNYRCGKEISHLTQELGKDIKLEELLYVYHFGLYRARDLPLLTTPEYPKC